MSAKKTPANRQAAAFEEPRKVRADSARNRARVLEAARALFGQRGAGVEIDDVARSAGVGVGTVYRHFPTKQALVHAVISEHAERLLADAHAKATASDPGRAFFEFLESFLHEAAAKTSLIDATSRDGLAAPALTRAATDAMRRTFRSAVRRLLTRAQEAKAVRPDIDVLGLVALLRGTLAALEIRETNAAQRRVIFEVMCDGLRARQR